MGSKLADHYAILGVSPAADPEVIRAAYRALARKYHPDLTASACTAEHMRALNAAYEVLSDTERRLRYDQKRQEEIESLLTRAARREAPQSTPSSTKSKASLPIGWQIIAAGLFICVMVLMKLVIAPAIVSDYGLIGVVVFLAGAFILAKLID